MVFSPLVIPWGKNLLIYCITSWFLLWVLFFIQMNREANPNYGAGLISDGAALGFAIFVFIIVINVRSIIQLIWFKINAKRNHT
jgi:hypothetical protein